MCSSDLVPVALTASPLMSEGLHPTAHLVRTDTGAPLQGLTIRFEPSVGQACTAVTDAQGLASCTELMPSLGGYQATFSQAPDYQPAEAHGSLY